MTPPLVQYERMKPWPSIDVVIPTFNCRENLTRCLRSVRDQQYDGKIIILIVDGGSSDGSVEVAKQFDAELFVNPGQYGTGLSGARHFGEQRGTSELIWILDSDNFLVGDHVAKALVSPFLELQGISLTVPETALDPGASRFNNWLALDEIRALRAATASCNRVNDWLVTDDLTYGLTNACLIRRTALEAVQGYDSDVRVLQRLRVNGLARAVIVPLATFYHNQTTGMFDYWSKWTRRMIRYASLTDAEVAAHFVEDQARVHGLSQRFSSMLKRALRSSISAPSNFVETGDSTWLVGLVYPLILALIVLSHPRALKRTLARAL